jgi:hypothetical protein
MSTTLVHYDDLSWALDRIYWSFLFSSYYDFIKGYMKSKGSNLKCCPLSDSMWINCYTEEILVNMKIGDNGSLKTLHTIKFSVGNIAISRQGDLLISAEASQLLIIPYKEKSMKRSQFSVSPLVTTFALHVAFDKVLFHL